MLAGAILTVPVFLIHRDSAAASAAPAQPRAEAEATCSPFAESFAAMRAEADRIASLAASSVSPVEDGEVGAAAILATWREISSSARTLDSWILEANSENAPLTMREAAILTDASPITAELRWDAADITGRLTGVLSDDDSAWLVRQMDEVARAASAVARALDPVASCQAASIVTYAPHTSCETLDPEYQYSMNGACVQ